MPDVTERDRERADDILSLEPLYGFTEHLVEYCVSAKVVRETYADGRDMIATALAEERERTAAIVDAKRAEYERALSEITPETEAGSHFRVQFEHARDAARDIAAAIREGGE